MVILHFAISILFARLEAFLNRVSSLKISFYLKLNQNSIFMHKFLFDIFIKELIYFNKSTIFYATKLLFLLLVKHNTIFYHLFNGISHFLEFSFRVNMRLEFRYLKGSLNSIIRVFSLFSFAHD